jgi:sulfur-carrier protein
MAIRVEFYGIARQRAGVSSLEVGLTGDSMRLADLFQELAHLLPRFGEECIADGRLRAALGANVDGVRFVSDPQTPIRDGECLLIVSADAGG